MNQNNFLNNKLNCRVYYLYLLPLRVFVTTPMSAATLGATLGATLYTAFVFAPATTLCINLRNACAQVDV